MFVCAFVYCCCGFFLGFLLLLFRFLLFFVVVVFLGFFGGLYPYYEPEIGVVSW